MRQLQLDQNNELNDMKFGFNSKAHRSHFDRQYAFRKSLLVFFKTNRIYFY